MVRIRKLCLSVLGALLLLTALSLLLLGPRTPARAAWSYGDWAYRRQVTISNTGTAALTDFQVRVTLDAAFDFGKALPDGSDLRATEADGETPIPLWIESWNPISQTAMIWVRVPSVPTGESTVYLYYGNPSATSASDGDATFEFFDDFETPVTATGYYSLSAAQTVLVEDQDWEDTAPHNLSVIEINQGGYRYWGYYGLQAGNGGVGLARSNDLATWEKYSENPLFLNGRFPSVIRMDGTSYMMVTKDYASTSYVTLYTSTNGIDFNLVETVVAPESGNRNQNPNLFYNPNDGRYYLYWFRRTDSLREIRARHAAAVEDLDAVSDTVVLSSTGSMAAPNMIFYDGSYFLTTESLQGGEWTVHAYESTTSPLGGFTPLPGNPILAEGAACFAQHVFSDTLHTYYCKLTGSTWTVDYRTADLTAGRQAYPATLDPAKWTAVGGTWQPVTATQPDGSTGLVAEGATTGRQILRSTFSGEDYVVEVHGRQMSGRVWGLATRATDPDNMYFANLYEDLDTDDNFYLYRRVGGIGATLADAALGPIDPGIWHKMTIVVRGTEIEVYFDDGLQFQEEDSTLSSGSVGLLGEGETVAQFDDVLVRKSASPEPTVVLGPEESTLIISTWARPDPVPVAETLAYTLTYENTWSESLTGVVVTDRLDANVTFLDASPTPDGGLPDAPYWSLGTLSEFESGEIVITVTVNSPLPRGTVLTNTATIDSDQTEPESSWITTTVLAPDLALSKRDDADPVVAGASLTYTLAYTNAGDVAATGAVITDLLDSRVTFAGATPPPTGGSGTTRYWDLGTISTITPGQILVYVTVITGLQSGDVLTNTAVLAAREIEPLTVVETTGVTPHSDLVSVALRPQAAITDAGESIAYTLTAYDAFGNSWDVTAGGTYTISPAAGGTWIDNVYTAEMAGTWIVTGRVDGESDTATLTVEPTRFDDLVIAPGTATIAAGESQAYTAEAFDRFGNSRGDVTAGTDFAIVEPGHGGTWIDNVYVSENYGTWTVRGTYHVLTDEATLNVLDTALALRKSDGITTTYAGDWLTYTLTYSNTGNQDTFDVVITDTLPAQTEFQLCHPAAGVDCQHLPPDRVVLRVPTLPAGTQDQAQIAVAVDEVLPAGGTALTNTAVLSSPILPAPLVVRDVDRMGTLPDLVIAVDHAPSLFIPGGAMTYTVTYGNVGHMDATGVGITATLPAGTSYAGTGWTTSDGQTYVYDAGDLPAGETGRSVPFVVTYPDQPQIDQTEVDAIFAIFETGSGRGDATPVDNTAPVVIGVPDLVVRQFTVEPMPPVAGEPMTFTVVIENQGTGPAWNLAYHGGFYVDIYTATIPSYPFERNGFVFQAPPALMAGVVHTEVIVYEDGLTLEQLAQVSDGFYVRVDNHAEHAYGLVPESDEWNNVAGPLSIWTHATYLPLVLRP